jgi:hypothetical protein
MSVIYCDICHKNLLKKNFISHHHKLRSSEHPLIKYFPKDLINIIDNMKDDMELYSSYDKFYKFVRFFIEIKDYIERGYPIEYSCYKNDHYIKDIYKILNYELKNFKNNNVFRHYNHKGIININSKRKIFKIFLFFNPENKKYFVEIL